ncbi:Lactose permease [Klebsiella pneumoniae]|nr:Lactose permease [Klebsiella pneumoniae]
MYYLKNTNFWMFGLFFFFYFFIMGAYFPFFPIWLHDIILAIIPTAVWSAF